MLDSVWDQVLEEEKTIEPTGVTFEQVGFVRSALRDAVPEYAGAEAAKAAAFKASLKALYDDDADDHERLYGPSRAASETRPAPVAAESRRPRCSPGRLAIAANAGLEHGIQVASRTRTHRPMSGSGAFPVRSSFRTVWWFSFRIEATSATVRKSSGSGMP